MRSVDFLKEKYQVYYKTPKNPEKCVCPVGPNPKLKAWAGRYVWFLKGSIGCQIITMSNLHFASKA